MSDTHLADFCGRLHGIMEFIEVIKAATAEEALSKATRRGGDMFIVTEVAFSQCGVGVFEAVATMEKTFSDTDLRPKSNHLIDAANRVIELHDTGKLGGAHESLAIQILRERIQEF